MPLAPPRTAAMSGPSRREYAAMLLPFILSTVTQPLIGAVDTAVMGRLSAPSYIAGVAVGAVIFNTLYWLLGFLRVGSTGFSAQALATGDAEAAWKAFLLPGIMALLLGAAILLCRDAIFAGAMFLVRLDPAAREVAGTYYDILIWTAPLTLLNYAILGWLMGQARIRASLLMQIGGNAVNMLLDLLFVSLFGWGVPGVAAASVLA
ncbi:MATE family efflux transporter, partial [uncultured Desulfovibrio sp.]|uniref:MATE family efflux transporter n=1 Tax=uncultured Desulfovibrio sp. TaxID=167968 RepID=UPI002804AF85